MLNPFSSQCAGVDLDRRSPDVAAINAQAFLDCQRMIQDVRQTRQTQALLLTGPPGSGKTHLLGRVQGWLEEWSAAGETSVFVPIRMVTNARMLWRLFREHLANALLIRRKDGSRCIHQVLKRDFEERAETSRDLSIVLSSLLRGERVLDAAAWLRGEELPQAALDALGLMAPRDDEQQEEGSRRIVKQLCQMIAPAPVVLCLDQLESIQSTGSDKESFRSFGETVSELHDLANNLAIISCLQSGLLNAFLDGVGGGQNRDRIQERKSALQPLTLDQATILAAARLDADDELRRERAGCTNALWPLDANAFRARFPSEGYLVARKAIALCSDLFEQWRGSRDTGPATDQEFLEQHLEERLKPVSEDESERVLRTGLLTLFRLRGLAVDASSSRGAAAIDGVVEAGRRVAISVCNQRPQGRGLTNRLRGLEAAWPAGVPELAIFRDARRGIGPGAVKAREALANLESRGARFVQVEHEALAALKALNELLADAKSGDLAFRGDIVGLTTVENWLATHLPSSLQSLLDSFIEHSNQPAWLPALTELVNEARIVRLEDASDRLGLHPEEVEDFVQLHPSLFGFAGGGIRVLYRAAEPPVPSPA